MSTASFLIVDDSEDNLFLMQNLLLSTKAKIDIAKSGTAALELLKTNQYTALLLDYMMPEMDGLQLATLVREDPIHKDTPITFVTAVHKKDERIEELRMIPNSDILYKPVNAKELREHVGEYIKAVEGS